MPSSVQITLRNMRFQVLVGILPHEAEFPQPLEIDLTVHVGASEAGTMAVDYRDLHTIVTGVVSRPPLHFIETIAEQIVREAMQQPAVIGARVAVRKPHVALGGPLDYAEVVVQDGVRE